MKRISTLVRAATQAPVAAFGDYTPFPSASDRAAWQTVDAKLACELVHKAEALLASGVPPLPATLYLDFTRTGNRARFEDAYFARRIRLNVLTLAECIEHKGRFLDAVIDCVIALCEESGWALPAHNSYVRDAPQRALPDCDKPVMDLFACETGALLALVHHLLREELNAVTPLVRARIRQELEKRIFRPYVGSKFWWMGYDSQPTNNWTVWCTQNVLLAAFVPNIFGRKRGVQLEETRTRIVKRAAYSIVRFLSEYGADGCCDEGAQYYRHAGLCLYGALSVLRGTGGDACARVFDNAQIRNIAEYIVNVHAAGRYYLNFADCAAVAGYAGIREYLFGKAVGSKRLMAFAARGWRERYRAKSIHNYTSSDDTLNLFYLVQELFTSQEALLYAETAADADTQPLSDCAYPSVGLYISRDARFCLGVKGGCNADSHNHNDTGSFILYKDGAPFIIDVGVETYSKKTFSADRYDIWTMQSAYHNVTNFDGAMQKDGKQHKATAVRYKPSDERTTVSMQLAASYGEESGVTSYVREVAHEKGARVTVTDTVRGDFSAAYFTLMTQEAPVVQECAPATVGDGSTIAQPSADARNGSRATLTVAVGDIGTVTLSSISPLSAKSVQIETISVTDSRLLQSWHSPLYRVRVAYTGAITAAFA